VDLLWRRFAVQFFFRIRTAEKYFALGQRDGKAGQRDGKAGQRDGKAGQRDVKAGQSL
jgi:hypothetical protein